MKPKRLSNSNGFLQATAEPGDLRALASRRFCTRILGGDAQTLFDLHENVDAWEKPSGGGARSNGKAPWDRAGPVGLLEWVLRAWTIPVRRFADPHRRRTSAHQLASPGGVAAAGLAEGATRSRAHWRCIWGHFERTREVAGRLTDDDALIRLESDEHAVKLVTIHKSKGLQYPVVYCPFLWKDQMLRPQRFGVDRLFMIPMKSRRWCSISGRDEEHAACSSPSRPGRRWPKTCVLSMWA